MIKPKYKNYSKKAQKTLSQLWQDVKDCGENNPELKKKILGKIKAAEWFADLSMGSDKEISSETHTIKLEPPKVSINGRDLSLDESYEWFQEAIEEKATREKFTSGKNQKRELSEHLAALDKFRHNLLIMMNGGDPKPFDPREIHDAIESVMFNLHNALFTLHRRGGYQE